MKERADREREQVGLPARPFLYTLDQIAQLIQVVPRHLKQTYIHFEGRTIGGVKRDMIRARNIAPSGEKPEWRVIEVELVRWFRHKGYRIYEKRAIGSEERERGSE